MGGEEEEEAEAEEEEAQKKYTKRILNGKPSWGKGVMIERQDR